LLHAVYLWSSLFVLFDKCAAYHFLIISEWCLW